VAEYLEHWSEVYALTYAAAPASTAGDFDLSGWRASDTGAPLPAAHMGEWVDRTVDLIARLRPKWVLEPGCGTGMLAHRLAPLVSGYVGTDVVAGSVRIPATQARKVSVVRAAAHELDSAAVASALTDTGFPVDGPDCVVLNSVTQCFPDLGYLEAVLGAAVRTVAPGGHVVIGDNRHAGLHTEFCTWVEHHRDPAGAGLADRAAARAERDEELLFDPVTLARCAARVSRDTGRDLRIATFPKLMWDDSELTRYRFDCVLSVDPPEPLPETRSVTWAELSPTQRAGGLRTLLAERAVRVRDIPNGALPGVAGPTPTAAQLSALVAGDDVAVVLSSHDPRLLEVVSPARAAWRGVDEVAALPAGAAHEPFPRFVRQRIRAAARAHLRKVPSLTGADVPIDVVVPPSHGAPL
jgi:SAM-dependent methyltransferase